MNTLKTLNDEQTVGHILEEREKVTEYCKAIIRLLYNEPIDHVAVQSAFMDMQSHLANLVSLAGDSSQREGVQRATTVVGALISINVYAALEMFCNSVVAIPIDLTKRPIRVGVDFGALGTRIKTTFQRG